jgi:putative YhdH/YhfP family quinone oxidoreductase
MNTPGGFSEYISVPATWIIKLPKNLSLRESMMYGTAGFTAALSIYKLIASGIKPSDGDILVTGATGGVGSVAVSILGKLGYDVIAATGKPEAKDMLIQLGAKDIVLRDALNDQSKKMLLKGQWAGVIDTVGGHILETAIKSTQYGGCVTCCGNVASHELSTTVYPFIIRGISLLGIDSVQCPMNLRKEVWEKLSGIWKSEYQIDHVEEISLMSLSHKIDQMLVGKSKGRIIVKID